MKHQGSLRAQQGTQYFHRVRADKEEKGQKGLLHWGKQAVKGLLAILVILLLREMASKSNHLFKSFFIPFDVFISPC